MNSTVPRRPAKPERPDGSPLFWHATGYWAKKICGKLVYFGRGAHDDALAAYLKTGAGRLQKLRRCME